VFDDDKKALFRLERSFRLGSAMGERDLILFLGVVSVSSLGVGY